jgi:hypothetical protein
MLARYGDAICAAAALHMKQHHLGVWHLWVCEHAGIDYLPAEVSERDDVWARHMADS